MTDIYRVALEASVALQRVVNVWHVSAERGLEATINSTFETAVMPYYTAAAGSAVTFDAVVATDIETLTQNTRALGDPGTQDGELLPPQNAAVISWRTGYIGRKFRGRSYIFGAIEPMQNAGEWSGAHVTAIQNLALALQSVWPSAFGGNLVLYHTDATTPTPIISYIIRSTVYTQRRRTLGVGM